MEQFLRERRGRYYVFERCLLPFETVIAEIPIAIYRNVISDIGISASCDTVGFFVTFSLNPESKSAIWQRTDKNLISKAARAIKIINSSDRIQSVCVRIAF